MSRRHYAEGEEVLVGGTGFGRHPMRATVAQRWEGVGLVMVIPEGRSKPVPRPPSRIRPAVKDAPKTGALVRQPTTKAELRAVPRARKPWRSSRYLRFVRSQPCCFCGHPAPSQAHHQPERGHGTTGGKCTDSQTAPLCAAHHERWHSTGALGAMSHEETLRYILTHAFRTLQRYVETGGGRRSA